MFPDSKDICWYVLFATKGRVATMKQYFEKANIECFYPLYNIEKRIRNCERTKPTLQPLFRNLLFVKSSQECLAPHLRELRQWFSTTNDLYYRYSDGDERKIIVVPETQMQNFIVVTSCNKKRVIYLSNEEVNFEKGTKVRVIEGDFAGVEGIFMKIKGCSRVVVSLTNLLSVATAFIPTRCIIPVE
jgi:transcription antitermination factor NusG